MKTFRLKKGADRRVRQGHPWVFASELAHSAREVSAGEVVELRDAADHFLAYGYAHPSAQIAFRKLSSRQKESDVFTKEFFVRRLRAARELRKGAGWTQFSHRWLFAEADGVPGLVVDAFLTSAQGWLIVVQASTAGADRALSALFAALEEFEHELGLMSVIEAPSSKSRASEGLKIEGKRLVSGSASDLDDVEICLVSGLKLRCDILNGQKTGFFLDQQWNTRLLGELLKRQFAKREEPVRVLDICCYAGQWAAQAAKALRECESAAHVTLMDISESAMSFAEKNVRGLAERVEIVLGDALDKLGELPAESFDVVICDPPAFVKKKADLENGMRAYVKLNREALRRAKPGGILVASSCSGLVRSGDWRQVLADASGKAGRMFQQTLKGGHGPDHPVRAEFPEGSYLKCSLGRVDYPF